MTMSHAQNPPIITHIPNYGGACSQADWSVSSHSQSAAVCSRWLSPAWLPACTGKLRISICSIQTEKGPIRGKEENHTCLCSIIYWALDQGREMVRGKVRRHAVGINVYACVYMRVCVGGWTGTCVCESVYMCVCVLLWGPLCHWVSLSRGSVLLQEKEREVW